MSPTKIRCLQQNSVPVRGQTENYSCKAETNIKLSASFNCLCEVLGVFLLWRGHALLRGEIPVAASAASAERRASVAGSEDGSG